jgi:hypothetical protein
MLTVHALLGLALIGPRWCCWSGPCASGTRLSFNLIYASEFPAIEEMVTAFASEATSAGITIDLRSQSESYISVHYYGNVSTADMWAMLDFGGLPSRPRPSSTSIPSTGTSLAERA